MKSKGCLRIIEGKKKDIIISDISEEAFFVNVGTGLATEKLKHE